jgi:DNA-binding LacI/PurR family transcriptional regulator
MGVTLRDVGQKVGVSHTTVARALRGDRNVSEIVRQRVTKAARDLNYGKMNRFVNKKSIAVCVMNVNVPICSSILKGAEDVLHENGYSVVVQSVGCEGRHPSEIIPMFRSRGIGGVILQQGMLFKDLSWLMDSIDANFPIVLADCRLPHINTPFVVSDNFGGAVKLVKELAAQNCRNIAFIGLGAFLSSVNERYEGYRTALEYCNLPVKDDLILLDSDEGFVNHPKFRSWINGDIDVDGIVTANDLAFEILVQNCLFEHRPFLEKCRFATFDYPVRVFSYPMPIIVAVQDTYRMGAKAAEIAVNLCESGKKCDVMQQLVLDVEIVRNVNSHMSAAVFGSKTARIPQF